MLRLEAGQRRGPKRRSPRHLALRAKLVPRVSVMLLRLPPRFKFVKCAFATSALRCETSVVSHSPESEKVSCTEYPSLPHLSTSLVNVVHRVVQLC